MDQNNNISQDTVEVQSTSLPTESSSNNKNKKAIVVYIILSLLALSLAGIAAYQTMSNMGLKKELEESDLAYKDLMTEHKTLEEQNTLVSNELHLLKNPVVETKDMAVQFSSGEYQKIGQVFILEEDTTVNGFKVASKLGAGEAVYMYISEATTPEDADIEEAVAEVTINPKTSSVEGMTTFNFAKPITLSADTNYFMWFETQDELSSLTFTYKMTEGKTGLYNFTKSDGAVEADWVELPNAELVSEWQLTAF